MKNTFWSLLRESVLVTGIIALAFVVTACFLWATGQDLPPTLVNALFLVLAFFFGAKAQARINSK